MPIKMRVLCTPGKKKFLNLAGIIKSEFDLVQNSVDTIPPAYSCDKERIVILAVSGKGDVSDSMRRFCRELNKTRTANVALLVDGTEVYANNIKEILKAAGTNVIEDVMYVKCGLPFLSGVKPEEKTAVLDWLNNRVLNQLR